MHFFFFFFYCWRVFLFNLLKISFLKNFFGLVLKNKGHTNRKTCKMNKIFYLYGFLPRSILKYYNFIDPPYNILHYYSYMFYFILFLKNAMFC
jgi:hypothetical protein